MFKRKVYHQLLNWKEKFSDKLEANLGFLYENAIAQMIKANGRELYYHTWKEEEKVHSYEVDFLISSKGKIIPIEVKSSETKNHTSINSFCKKYSKVISRRILFSQRDVGNEGMLEFKPIYLAPIILEDM